jgi:hypothetical protein
MERLSFDEIDNWQVFEDLVADYFREIKGDQEFNVTNVEVKQTGAGGDGGRDILVSLSVNDSIVSFTRIWVVQCKFYGGDVGKRHLSDVNIPTLIHEYGANGYLLICKNHVTASLSAMIENLKDNCRFKYHYENWNGTNFLSRIRIKPRLIENYFPSHHAYLSAQENKLTL